MQLPSDIIDLEDYTESINMMVYADPGVGKTVFAGSAKTLIIATENGTVAAARQGSKAKVWNCVNDWKKVEAAYEWLFEATKEDDFPFDWIAIDTGTAMQALIVQDIVGEAADIDETRNRDKVELQEWGEAHNRFKRYVNLFNDLPVNTLWLAQGMQVEDEEGNEFRLPEFQGKGYGISVWVAAQMHAYGYMHMVPVKNKDTGVVRRVRRIQWQASEKFRAKDRFDALGVSTSGKTLQQLTDMITKTATAEPIPAPAKKVAATKKEN